MITDLDIYRSANILLKQHGEDAPLEAAQRADAMLVVKIRRKSPSQTAESEPVHAVWRVPSV